MKTFFDAEIPVTYIDEDTGSDMFQGSINAEGSYGEDEVSIFTENDIIKVNAQDLVAFLKQIGRV